MLNISHTSKFDKFLVSRCLTLGPSIYSLHLLGFIKRVVTTGKHRAQEIDRETLHASPLMSFSKFLAYDNDFPAF